MSSAQCLAAVSKFNFMSFLLLVTLSGNWSDWTCGVLRIQIIRKWGLIVRVITDWAWREALDLPIQANRVRTGRSLHCKVLRGMHLTSVIRIKRFKTGWKSDECTCPTNCFISSEWFYPHLIRQHIALQHKASYRTTVKVLYNCAAAAAGSITTEHPQ